MPITRIKNNQITDATIVASAKLVDASISAGKLAANLTYGSNLTVTGNLTVNGTTTALDTVNTVIEDPVILLAKNETGVPSKDIGFIGERGDSNNVAWIFDETDDTFKAGLTTDDGTGTAITLASLVDSQFKDITMVNLAPSGNVTTALNADSTIEAGTSITANTTITATGNITGGNLVTAGDVTTVTVTASGAIAGSTTITATGNVDGGNLTTSAAMDSATINTTGEATLASAIVSDLTSGRVVLAGTAGAVEDSANLTFDGSTLGITGALTASTTASVTGNITGGNVTTAGITNSGSVVSEAYNGDAPTITATGTNNSVTIAPNGNGTIVASSKRITSVATPSGDNDAANKAYVDSVAEGLDIKESVRVATTAALPAVTYDNGSSGVGATLTADANGALAAIDGVTVSATTTRLLIKDQSSALQNGIYVVTTVGDAGTAFVLTRSGDMDGSPASEIPGAFVFVEEGTTNADNGFVCTTNAPVTMGTTAINFTQFSGAGQITAGDGLAKAGDVLSVNVDDVTTAISGDAVVVKTSANLTTPNIGVANGDSFTASSTITATGNVAGGNLTTAGAMDSVTINTTGEATLASAIVSDLTSGRVVLAGTAGAIEDSGNFTFDGSTAAVTGAITASTTITATGNVAGGNLTTGGRMDATGAATALSFGTANITIGADDINSGGSAITINQDSQDLDFVVEGNGDANLFRTDAGTDTVLISTATATTGATLKVAGTDSILIPVGTTAQRPTPATGMIRFNTSIDAFEFYDSAAWTTAGSDFTVIATQTFSGDNSTVAFTLSEAQTTASCIVSINGVVQLPTTAYAVSSTTLTFTEAPLAGDVIEVRKITTTTTITSLANGDSTAIIEAVDSAAVVRITGDLNPAADGTQDLGSSSFHWQEAHLGSAIFYDSDDSNTVTLSAPATVGSNVAFTLPAADGSAGQALITDGSGAMSFGAAGATVTSDTSTDAERLIYVGSITTGALTAVTQDSGLTYNPSTGSLTSAAFIGSGASLTTLNGSNITTGTVAAARVATLNQNTTGTAGGLSSAVTVSLTGDVTGSATFTSAGDTASITTTIAANSVALGTDTTGNYVAAGATSGSGISGSVSSEGGTFTVASNATNANTGSTIVFRDGSGNFSAGIITATSTQARYADLAEMYAADGDIEAGTVVHFAGEGKLAACDEANHHAVAGIISTDPAYLMNTDQEGVALAISGRVPCKVTGVVNAGDLMVSAGNGMAMANNSPAIGTVIGKAIESNEGGDAVIEVLAMMM